MSLRNTSESSAIHSDQTFRPAFGLPTWILAGLAFFWLCGSKLLYASDAASDADAEHQQMVFFESNVRPLLAEKCWSCHAEEAQKGGLRLDSRSSMLSGGDTGESLVPGDVDASLIVQAIRYEGYEMPPSGKLADEQIAIIERWVEMGAFWPGEDKATRGQETQATKGESSPFSDSDFEWWAIQPVTDPVVPNPKSELVESDISELKSVAAWARNDIDHFILNRMVSKNLAPAPEADRETLIRRLYFDLVGLPPSPDQIQAFVQDTRDDAYERLVDQLLDSPQYGERWARHWLDLVRYADSDGYRADHYRPDAWRYRDYVIDSLNDDKPYDQFVREQIAGDELYPDDPEALIATGYLRNGIYEYNIRDAIGQWNVILNEITDTTGDVFLGLGMQCARCHDHKFDPILQSDYFRLRAYFEPLAWRDDQIIATADEQAEFKRRNEIWLEKTKAIRSEIDALEAEPKQTARDKAIGRFPANIQAMFAKTVQQRSPFEQQIVELAFRQVTFEYDRLDSLIKGESKDRLLELRRELAKFDDIKPEPLPTAMVATDIGPTPPPTTIPKKRKEVQPGTLALLEQMHSRLTTTTAAVDTKSNEDTSKFLVRSISADNSGHKNEDAVFDSIDDDKTTGRRSELANWIASPQNPLTVRVIVNRVWQYHFGNGLAANSSDFGTLGGPPSHPELLDYLVVRFLENGWRLKPLHRMIVTSATYRQSSKHPQFETFQAIDPTNDWYWRYNSRRLDAEQIRDALLLVTGKLDPKRGGPGGLGDQSRRSIYTRVMRNARDPLLEVFDLPLFFSSSSSRDTTTSPIQSLHLFNNPSMLQLGRSLAKRVQQDVAKAPNANQEQQQISHAWKLVYGREPGTGELDRALRFLENQTELLRRERESKSKILQETSQMPYRDGQAVLFKADDTKAVLSVEADERLDLQDFTFETYFQVRSIYDSGAVRTIAASGSGNQSTTGWAFGVTGKGSRRKPQTLVIQLFGPTTTQSEKVMEAALFSDQHVELNTPYYAAVSVQFAKDGQPGEAVFYLKDLSDDEKPISVARQPHDITAIKLADDPGTLDAGKRARSLRIGGRGKDASGIFDGLIDDIRLSNNVLTEDQLLLVQETAKPNTVGYWRFESVPGFLADSGTHQLPLFSSLATAAEEDPADQAFIDLCHVLLNSNTFLYVY